MLVLLPDPHYINESGQSFLVIEMQLTYSKYDLLPPTLSHQVIVLYFSSNSCLLSSLLHVFFVLWHRHPFLYLPLQFNPYICTKILFKKYVKIIYGRNFMSTGLWGSDSYFLLANRDGEWKDQMTLAIQTRLYFPIRCLASIKTHTWAIHFSCPPLPADICQQQMSVRTRYARHLLSSSCGFNILFVVKV